MLGLYGTLCATDVGMSVTYASRLDSHLSSESRDLRTKWQDRNNQSEQWNVGKWCRNNGMLENYVTIMGCWKMVSQ